jgi:hypothetical protein
MIFRSSGFRASPNNNAGQTLAVRSMNLSKLQRHAGHLDVQARELVDESPELADDLTREIRKSHGATTISFF